jgi:hypothetical protein
MNSDTFFEEIERQLLSLSDRLIRLKPGLHVQTGVLPIPLGKQAYLSCLVDPKTYHIDLCVRVERGKDGATAQADVTKSDGEVMSEMDQFDISGDMSEGFEKIACFLDAQTQVILDGLSGQ